MKVYLPKSLVDRFRKATALKYQRVERGLLSLEVENALKSHLASINSTQAQSTQSAIVYEKVSSTSKVHNLVKKIKKYLVECGRYDDEFTIQYIPTSHLIEALHTIKGTDKRTVDKWVGLLKQYGCIKQSGDLQWQLI